MAKSDINKSGHFEKKARGVYCSRSRILAIERENRGRVPPQKGIREKVLAIYRREGILAAYNTLEDYNKRFAKPPYTREIFEAWIAEENRQFKGKKIDDGIDR